MDGKRSGWIEYRWMDAWMHTGDPGENTHYIVLTPVISGFCQIIFNYHYLATGKNTLLLICLKMSWEKYAFLKLLDKIDFVGYGHSHLSQRHCDTAGPSEPKNLVKPSHLQSGESTCPFPPKGRAER